MRGGLARLSGLPAAPKISKHLLKHPRAYAACIDELAFIGEIAAQQRCKMRLRSFRVGPADDDEPLAIERFGLAP